jgi:pimeloyl-ACP methyl ester carboxylesterase
MIALIRHLGMKKPVVIGHSMGGSLAAHLAALEPELPGGVVLIDPGFRLRSDLQREEVIEALREEMTTYKQMDIDQVAAQIRKRHHPDWPDYYIQPSAEAKLKMDMKAINIFYTIDATWEEDLKKADCPMLLITSDVSAGAIVTAETAEYARSLDTNIEVLHIPGAGHSIHREKYPEVLQGIKNFLKSL